ncbi:hypothetical protein KGF57_003084 [Candida theae]|uniref:JmjC domain-containing protein n=1 Tax=Candida theae TaxID=1198502 RepID=A0AAD5FYC0_9ASCO|nr:uncharacterized protein KGF57_003084 [Candida theae]KAI5957817.1 hypothetical protein KGF57_003084 [Candida theae]
MPPTSNIKKRQKIVQNQYSGYIIPSPTTKIDAIDVSSSSATITPETFFKDYVSKRKPVKIVNNDDANLQFINVKKFQLKNLQTTLNYNDEELQVEELFQGGFGSGQKRVDMMLSDLVDEFENGDRELYLTTQYDREGEDEEEVEREDAEKVDADNEEDKEREVEEEQVDEDEEEEEGMFEQMSNASSIDLSSLRDDFDDFDNISNEDSDYEAYQRVKTLYQPPLTNLAKHSATTTTTSSSSSSSDILPTNPPLIPNLIPQQINIWMGKTKNHSKNAQLNFDTDQLDRSIPNNGTSSGLHHDHADNLYILVQGRKRFTIYSPNDALKLYTVGKVYKIFSNGVIDYECNEQFPHWRSIRDDGAMIEDVLHWQLSQTEDEDETEQLNELLSVYETKRKSIKPGKERVGNEQQSSRDPPSFSKIPPCLLHIDEVEDAKQREKLIEFANTHFPGFLELNKITVWLNAGEMLYLPASWFHEVSSFGDAVDSNKPNGSGDVATDPGADTRTGPGTGVHIALNYWFVPPNKDDFNNPYTDGYWEQDWQETKEAIELFAKGSSAVEK